MDQVSIGTLAGAAAGAALAGREVALQEWLAQGLERLAWLELRDCWATAALAGACLALALAGVGAAVRRSAIAGGAFAAALGAALGVALGTQVLGLSAARPEERPWAWAGVVALGAIAFTVLTRSARVQRGLRARRPALRAAAAAALALLGLLHAVATASPRTVPRRGASVVLIVIDTLRADHVGSYGHAFPTTPALDAFTRDAVAFRNAIALAPWTTPSLAATLASRFPSEVFAPRAPLAPRQLMLAELFRDAGHRTAAFVSHLNVASERGFAQGFEVFDQADARGHAHVSSPSLTRKAAAFLERHRDEAFFLLVHYFDPHVAYQAQPGCEFDPGYAGPVRSGLDHGELNGLVRRLGDRDLAHVRALYDSEICFTDRHVGALLDRLRALGLYESAAIAVTADHGEEFAEREPFIGHGRHLHQELVRVPLLVKPPGRGAGRVSETWVSLLDLAPTLAGLAGLGTPVGFRGRPLPLGGDGAPAPLFSENDRQEAVIADGWKLMREGTSERLFELRSDPGETRDRRATEGARAERLGALLDRWRAGLVPLGPGADVPSPFTPEQREQLRALGYTE